MRYIKRRTFDGRKNHVDTEERLSLPVPRASSVRQNELDWITLNVYNLQTLDKRCQGLIKTTEVVPENQLVDDIHSGEISVRQWGPVGVNRENIERKLHDKHEMTVSSPSVACYWQRCRYAYKRQVTPSSCIKDNFQHKLTTRFKYAILKFLPHTTSRFHSWKTRGVNVHLRGTINWIMKISILPAALVIQRNDGLRCLRHVRCELRSYQIN